MTSLELGKPLAKAEQNAKLTSKWFEENLFCPFVEFMIALMSLSWLWLIWNWFLSMDTSKVDRLCGIISS